MTTQDFKTDCVRQGNMILLHREHLQNLVGHTVTEAEAIKDWVKHLAIDYRQRHQ